MRNIFIALLLFAICHAAGACTTFCFDGIFGRNYDFMTGNGFVFINKRDVAKTSMTEIPAQWTSRYGSITFNQFGREFPTGGMNEAGLVVELMWLEQTEYPDRDKRPEVGGLEWIQYQLDNHASVKDVLNGIADTRIVSVAPLHFLIADKSGEVASVEFLAGKPVIHTGDALPFPVLTNDTYEKSVQFVKAGKKSGDNSLQRFSTAARMLKNKNQARDPIDYAFSILAEVAQKRSTQWSIVYDMKHSQIYFRTSQNPSIRSVAFSSFDFTCATPVKMVNMNQPGSGNIAKDFADYSLDGNRRLIAESYSRVPFLAPLGKDGVEQAATHPQQTRCVRPSQAAGI